MRDDDPHNQPTATKLLATFCLFLILFITTFDSNAIDGIVPLIQQQFNINDAQTAVIKTSSNIAHVLFLALVWIVGDALNRRVLYLASVSCWIAMSILSILLGSNSYLIFVGFRTAASAANAVFDVLLKVVLADLFRDRALGVAIMILTAAHLVSGIITSIVSSWIISSELPWQSALLAGPLLAVPPLLALSCTSNTFRRVHQLNNVVGIFTSAFGVLSIKSFVILAVCISLASFHMRSYTFWFPSMILSAWEAFPEAFTGMSYTTVTIFNSSVKMIGMFLGMPIILWLAQSFNHGTGPFSGRAPNQRAYPIVVSVASLLLFVFFVLAVLLVVKSYAASLACLFIFSVGNAASFSLTQQMLLEVVPTSSRAASVALFKLMAGIITAPSAQLAGMLSDAIRGEATLPVDRFRSYQLGILCSSLAAIASSILLPTLVWFYPNDKRSAEEQDDKWNEKTPLIGDTKVRAESLLETDARSRANTLTGFL